MNRALAALLVLLLCPLAMAQNALKPGDFIAVCGDSITEQKQYSVFIENYLLMCKPQADLKVMQFGWGGETSWGFFGKMPTQALKFDMTVATTCYGMNDGGYSPMNDAKAKQYKTAMTNIVQAFKKKGVRFIVVGSPGCVDTDTFKNSAVYNPTLAALRDLAKQVAEENGCAFANVHDAMFTAMTAAKAKLGNKYHVGGGDGVHPDKNGQLCMAYAFLKGLGVDGNIGTITVDLAASKAEATDGHKVLGMEKNTLTLESTRYPFCFTGDMKSTNSTRSMLEFLPFNQDLNRYMLVIKGAKGKTKITWGTTSKEFESDQLEKGINLAAEFLDNPFSEPFAKVEKAVRDQQNFETPLIKTLLAGMPELKKMAPDEADAFDRIEASAKKKADGLRTIAAQAVQPVKHTITIESAN